MQELLQEREIRKELTSDHGPVQQVIVNHFVPGSQKRIAPRPVVMGTLPVTDGMIPRVVLTVAKT